MMVRLSRPNTEVVWLVQRENEATDKVQIPLHSADRMMRGGVGRGTRLAGWPDGERTIGTLA